MVQFLINNIEQLRRAKGRLACRGESGKSRELTPRRRVGHAMPTTYDPEYDSLLPYTKLKMWLVRN